MNIKINILHRFFSFLNNYDYVLLDCQLYEDSHPEILLSKTHMDAVITELKSYKELENIRMSSNAIFSKLILNVKGEDALELSVFHQLVHKSLSYLTIEDVLLKKRQLTKVYVPALEHLLEYVMLKQFLKNSGMEERYFRYFDEFHILVQEGLLDYFNNKYGTQFSVLFDLTNYNETSRDSILSNLKALPGNRFPKNVNIRWSNFVGSLRQARII